jgi:hypothetical protein
MLIGVSVRMVMEWLTPEEAGVKWGIKTRRVQTLCSDGRITGAVRKGRVWLIPLNAPKPIDGRTKAAKNKQKI